ncbi:hypothetical protein Tco_1547443 [Tanacetum coccineum]
MSTLTFIETYNMIAFLEKPAESDGFHEIIDFLNANQIHYALTVNPSIYTSCIEQFWATTKANTVNGERKLQALVDKKRVIITESSIRSDLHLEDADGIDCFPTATIFEELTRMGRKQRKETEVPQDKTHHDDNIPIPSNDLLLSERKKKSRTTGLKRLRKFGKSSRAESSMDKESLGAQEDASKQERIKIIDETQGRLDDAEMFDTDNLHGDEVIMDMAVGEKQEKSAKVDEREVTTADEGVTAAKIDEITPTSAPTTIIDELTLAQTLIEIKAAKPKAVTTAATITTRPKARGVVVYEPSKFRTTTSSTQALQPLKTKDKGKAIMIEPEVPLKWKDQVALDEEITRNLEAQLQAEFIEEEKMARKKEEEANIALIESWENTQAMMESDRLLAKRL